MTELKRLWVLFRPYRLWMLLGTAAATLTLLSNVMLMAAASWFLAAMATAGAAGVAMNYFVPAALIRAAPCSAPVVDMPSA